MTPDEIRKLYRELGAATPEEYEQTTKDIADDPSAAIALFQVLRALANEDRQFAKLHQDVMMNMLGLLIMRELHRDEEFARNAGKVILAVMQMNAPPPRGRRATSA